MLSKYIQGISSVLLNKGMKTILYRLWKLCKRVYIYVFGNIPIGSTIFKQFVWDIKVHIDDIFDHEEKIRSTYNKNIVESDKRCLLKSKLCTESDFHQDWFKQWCRLFGYKSNRLNRKVWEFVTITQALYERDMLEPEKKGLGFGVGKEPLPSIFAARGCHILATDIGIDTKQGKIWHKSNQHLCKLEDLYRENICDLTTFKKYVSYQTVDMNDIPITLRDFDFTWSSCAFEHLGSIRNGKNFILNQLDCLKVGGWAIHTTEFNLTSDDDTLEKDDLVLFRRRDIEELIRELDKRGHYVEELDTSTGLTRNDYDFDLFPFRNHPHLKLRIGEYITTSIILIIRK